MCNGWSGNQLKQKYNAWMNKTPLFFKTSWMMGAGLLIIMCCFVYFPVFQNFFIWDDDYYLTKNPYLYDLDGLKRIWFDPLATPQYYPLVFTSFWIEHKIWAFDPLGYHVNNVIIHCLNALILWRILSFLGIKGSWLVAAIFAIHPVQIESVAWISERKNLLSGFFYFLSLYFFLRFYNPDQPLNSKEDQNKKSMGLYGISLFFFICALWSKTVACSLPAVILLICWWKKNCVGKKVFLMMIPYCIVGLGFAFLTVQLEKFSVGAIGHEWDFSFFDRFLIAGRALWFYMGKLVWPFPIIFTYPRWIIDDSVWWQYIYPLTFLFLIFILWHFRKNIGRGPLAAILFFAGSLFPALGFFNVYPMRFSFVADHFQYIPCIGIIAIFTSGAVKVIGERSSLTTFILLAGLLVFLGKLTWNQAPVYKNEFSLWKDTIRKNPAAWMAHGNLGTILARNGGLEEAIIHFRTAIKLKPDYLLAYNHLGTALTEKGELEEAIIQYRTAIKIKPDYFLANYNLGNTLVEKGELEEAIIHYKTAIAIRPDAVDAHFNLGNTLLTKGELEEAIIHYRIVIKIKPDDAEAHNNLGNTLVEKGKLEEAVIHYRIAIKIKPTFDLAHNNLRAALLQK